MRMANMERLEAIVSRLPEAQRVDIEEWGGHPTFRVNGRPTRQPVATCSRWRPKRSFGAADA
jgi:hypothetical protein